MALQRAEADGDEESDEGAVLFCSSGLGARALPQDGYTSIGRTTPIPSQCS